MSRFCWAVAKIPGLVPSDCHTGLRALRSADRKRIFCGDTRLLDGSICLDDALKHKYPQAARWDYGIGLRKGQRVLAIWVEVHPARSGKDVQSMLAKVDWLKARLQKSPALCSMTHAPYRWVASGKVKIPKRGRLPRLLNEKGICYPQETLRLS